jgi:aminoglycoside phosphotransferase (APT) family kinase protein
VYRWIDGEPLRGDRIVDMDTLAEDLAGFLAALYACTPTGPPPGAHSFGRGGPVSAWNDDVESNLHTLSHVVDVAAAREVWSAALVARHEMPPVWVHGDVTGTNLLMRDGRLAAVLDFGALAVGDPTADLVGAWEILDAPARAVMRARLGVDDATWLRGRAWALVIAVMTFPYYRRTMPERCVSRLAIARAVLADHTV